MSDWLYPISKNAGRNFIDARGRKVSVSFEAFRDFIITGRLRDANWYLATSYKAMQPGDRVWIYTGDRDIGLIGLATALSIEQPTAIREAFVHLRWDLAESRRLVADPFPATSVRRYVQYPRRPALSLDAHPKLIRELGKWRSRRAAAGRAALKPLRLRPIREILVERKTKHYKALLDHDHILGPIERALRRSGFEVGLIDTGKTQVDLAARKDGHIVIVEAKKMATPTGRNEGRAAFAQLHEYKWTLAQRRLRSPRFSLWASFSKKPAPEVIRFLEDHDVLVSWKNARAGVTIAAQSRKRIKRIAPSIVGKN